MGAFQKGRTIEARIFILSLILIFAGASRLVMKMSFGEWDEGILVEENCARVLPSYALLLTSIILCVWLPGQPVSDHSLGNSQYRRQCSWISY